MKRRQRTYKAKKGDITALMGMYSPNNNATTTNPANGLKYDTLYNSENLSDESQKTTLGKQNLSGEKSSKSKMYNFGVRP